MTKMINSKSNIFAGLFGNALEWYDFLLFASFSPIFAKLFFPSHSYFISLVSTFGVFALGFLIRPLGGFVLGYYGDKLGRKKTLIFSVTIMTVATLCIAALPSYAHIGLAAPLLFTLLRLLQGFAVGGELPNSATFLIESIAQKHKGLAGSLTFSTAFLGIVIGAGVATTISNMISPEQLNWAWRYACILGGLLGLIGIYMRLRCTESPVYLENTKTISHTPFRLIFSEYKLPLFLAAVLTSILAAGNYLLIAYTTVFLTKNSGFTLPKALEINFIALFLLVILIPFMGMIADKISCKKLYKIGLIALLVGIFPVFMLLKQTDFTQALYGEVLLAILLAPINATIATIITDMFPVNIRASGISMGYNIGQGLFGGTVPLISLTLIEYTGNLLAPAWYIFGLTLIVLILMGIVKTREVT